MLSGHFQGRLLAILSKMQSPNFVLEIGTYTGYSALALAEGLTEKGNLLTIDVNEELAPIVNSNILKSEYSDQINYVVGDAMEVIDQIDEQIDLIFIDADKRNYLNYYKKLIDKVSPGGLIIADNVLWSGKVVGWHNNSDDRDTVAIRSFNDYVHNDDRVENVLLPVRDGLMLLRKK